MFTTVSQALIVEGADFGKDPYGYDHAFNTSNLAHSVAQSYGLGGDELMLAKGIGMFHDLGRIGNWWESDSGHGVRSADLAAKAFRFDPNWCARSDLVDAACRIIAQHSIMKPPNHPLGIALYDADLLESARFANMGERGWKTWEVRRAACISQFARDHAWQETWLEKRRAGTKTGGKWAPGNG
jgi:HD superfamily phosphodiesterase